MGNYFDLIDYNDNNNDEDDGDDEYTLTDYRHLKQMRFDPKIIVFIYAVTGCLLFYKTFIYVN